MMAGWQKNDHWSAPHFDAYGFRRSELKVFADKLGMDLSVPLEEVTPTILANVDSKPLSEADVEILRMEVDSLRKQIRKLENDRPILIKKYREDDPLCIAIKLRNAAWSNYDVDNRRTIPKQDALIAQIKEQYSEFDMKDVQARAIEKVACPIQR